MSHSPQALNVRFGGDRPAGLGRNRTFANCTFQLLAGYAFSINGLSDAHAVAFISDLEVSRVLVHDGDTMRVYQKGKAKFGPFTFPVELVREIRLAPFESMQSHLVNGSMKRLDVTTRLALEGSGTHITNHSESIPDVWIPPLVGRLFIAHETREKFRDLRDEIIRRRQAAAGR